MNRIDNLSNQASQTVKIPLSDGTIVVFNFKYLPAVQRWVFGLQHANFTLNGVGLSASPNVLRPWKNVIPFGLACTSIDGLDPLFSDDFKTGRISLFVLSEADVLEIEEEVFEAI